jgi:enamine deaminase RidA (YjgF/YER057c/UK114 family)
MTTGIVNPEGVRRTTGYSHAKLRVGVPVFLTGQVAWDLEGKVVGRGDIVVQAEQVWANIHAVLAEIGAGADDIVKITTYATDARFMGAIGAAKLRQFDPQSLPASTFLVVAALADPDLLVEIEAVLMLPAGHPALSA